MSRRILRSAGVALALIVGLETGALAQDAAPTVDEIQAAEKAFAAGREAYKAGSFGEAAENFERADANAPNDRVLELAITSRDKAGQVDRAATLAQLGIDRYPQSERLRKLGEPLIERAKQEMFLVSITCDEPCSLLDGTRIVHGAPANQRSVYLTPGQHTIRAGWSEERSESKSVEGQPGGTQELVFKAPPIPPKPPPEAAGGGDGMRDTGPKEPPYGLSPVYFWISAGLTAAVGGVAIWSGVDTQNEPGPDGVREACAEVRRDQPEDCAELQEGYDKELRTNILLGATGVLGVGTVVLGALFTNWSGESSETASKARTTAKVSPWLNVGNGAMLGAQGRF